MLPGRCKASAQHLECAIRFDELGCHMACENVRTRQHQVVYCKSLCLAAAFLMSCGCACRWAHLRLMLFTHLLWCLHKQETRQKNCRMATAAAAMTAMLLEKVGFFCNA